MCGQVIETTAELADQSESTVVAASAGVQHDRLQTALEAQLWVVPASCA